MFVFLDAGEPLKDFMLGPHAVGLAFGEPIPAARWRLASVRPGCRQDAWEASKEAGVQSHPEMEGSQQGQRRCGGLERSLEGKYVWGG